MYSMHVLSEVDLGQVKEALSVFNALSVCVYIIRQLSSLRAPTLWFIDLTTWLLTIFNTLFWLYTNFFRRKRTKHENTRSLSLSYHMKMPNTDVNTGAQIINTERASLMARKERKFCCQISPDQVIWHHFLWWKPNENHFSKFRNQLAPWKQS